MYRKIPPRTGTFDGTAAVLLKSAPTNVTLDGRFHFGHINDVATHQTHSFPKKIKIYQGDRNRHTTFSPNPLSRDINQKGAWQNDGGAMMFTYSSNLPGMWEDLYL